MMSRTSKTLAGLGLAVAFAFTTAGCEGKGGKTDDAVVFTEPGVTVPSPSTGGATPAPTASASPTTSTPAATTPTPAAPVKAEGWGTLKGQVVFGGNPPAPTDLVPQGKADKDPTLCAKDAPIKVERLVVDGATKGVKNVLIYVPKPTAINEEAKSGAAAAKVVFDQEKCVFVPHVICVMTGATLELKNSDPVNHNINPKTKNTGSNQLLAPNSTTPLKTQAAERTPGLVTCDIHPWMQAYWMVVDSPYFAVTDEKGNFEIKNVPAGTQKVVVWQEALNKGGFVTAGTGDEVAIKANDTTTQTYTIDPGRVLNK